MTIERGKRKLAGLFAEFLESEMSSGVVLFLATVVAITLANSPLADAYGRLWHAEFLGHTLQHWINDGLMAVFFLLIGLEIERELYVGELTDHKKALLPIVAAAGGMAVPAVIHFLLNHGTAAAKGAGIPTATDIAFAIGILSFLKKRIPSTLKVFLVALAIIDDLGAIVVIALFYAAGLSIPHLVAALVVFALLLALNRFGLSRLSIFLPVGLLMWYLMLQSGVHATIAGVLLAFAVPFRSGDGASPSYRLQHFLHKPVGFVIMPLFALANTGLRLPERWLEAVATANSLGIMMGLLIGKPLGIWLFSYLAVRWKLSALPAGVRWRHVVGAGMLGGIGFTMSIFITTLAFQDEPLLVGSKLSILVASVLAGGTGYLVLRSGTRARVR
ncbi:Na+/H+ antiporter NhaA [Geomonas paludis]|uniref:Na(+)/H(+) antiporter NhaA n=1 Tax=Geomonas paludis TaxID=2740185 RepID=A0A6V8MR96_9BACT|nr:Na+/H+ antiporter NhaA [Geomonas paludis]UPU35784.1 Na+/H+ antiporter NhaA [Geomonas paludis]GFO62636.1 Na(+)/H(+) antiporter NhaA [Geomonas paludis]